MERLIYDYSKLKQKIKKIYKNQDVFALEIGISYSTLNQKLNNKADFNQNEIERIVKKLDLNREEINLYFFAIDV